MKQLLKSEFFIHFKSKSLGLLFLFILCICLLVPQMMYISWGEAINDHVSVLKSLSLATDNHARDNIHTRYNYLNAVINTTDEQWAEMEMQPPSEEEMEIYKEEFNKISKYLTHNNKLIINSYKMTSSYIGRYLLTFTEEEYLLNAALLEALENDYPLYELYLGSYTKELMMKRLEKTEILLENDFELEYNRYNQNLINFFLYVFTDYPMYFIVIAMVFYAIRSFSDNSNPEAYKTIYSSAHSRTSINLTKIIVTTFILLLAFFVAFTIASIIVYFSYGLGEPLYPVIVSLSDTNVILTTKIQLIISQAPLVLLTMISMISLTYLISMQSSSSSLTFNIIGVYFIIHALKLFSDNILQFSPLYYLTTHETLYFLGNRSLFVVIIMVLLILITNIVTILYGNKKDLVGIKR